MNRRTLLNKIWIIAKPFKWSFILSYAILLIELGFNQVLPLLLGNVIDAAIYQSNIKLFLKASAFYSIIFIAYQACGYSQLQIWQVLNNKYVYSLRVKCYDKILSLKAKQLSVIKTGDMLQTINDDTMEFHHIIQRYAMRFINAGIGTVVSIVIVAILKWEISIIIAILIPVSVLVTKKIERKMKKASAEIRGKQGVYNAWLMEILKGFREIKLFAAEKTVFRFFLFKNHDIVRANVKQAKLQFASDQLISLIYFVAQIVFYVVCAFFVANKLINIGEYIAIATYYTTISSNIQRILRGNVEYQRRKVSVERVFTLLESDFEDENGLHDIHITNGLIDIKNVTFAYKEHVDTIKNLSYQINAGERIGVVGQSGVGKSTFAHLLVKLFTPDNGSIFIDGQNINSCTYSSIRKSIGIVSQETVIFDTTVRENISFDKNTPDKVIWEALDKAHLKADIEKLPNGLDTLLGKDGINLSGGQNQRLCIARMFYKNPQIVILDEATSALDHESEKDVQKALDELTKGRTSIVISHRLNSIKNTDRILVLHDGVQVGDDSYKNLIETNVAFKEMFKAQVEVA